MNIAKTIYLLSSTAFIWVTMYSRIPAILKLIIVISLVVATRRVLFH